VSCHKLLTAAQHVTACEKTLERIVYSLYNGLCLLIHTFDERRVISLQKENVTNSPLKENVSRIWRDVARRNSNPTRPAG
jgi:hypothetical protein